MDNYQRAILISVIGSKNQATYKAISEHVKKMLQSCSDYEAAKLVKHVTYDSMKKKANYIDSFINELKDVHGGNFGCFHFNSSHDGMTESYEPYKS